MPVVPATAPGKLILFGEHAVVYGKPAIAVPVQHLTAKAIVRPRPKAPPGEVWILAPDLELDTTLDKLPADNPIAAPVLACLAALGIDQPPALKLRVNSSIPIAAGLGSGAAVSVAILRGLSAFLGHPLSDEQISEITFEVEKLHHGTPSGIDNTVITFGKPVYFIKDEPIRTFQVEKPFTLVIADSGVSVPTRVPVGDVRSAWEAEPEKLEALFEQIGDISARAKQAIESGHNHSLGPLMDENQLLLQELSVSSEKLDRLAAAAKEAGALGSKLSGGGRGGNVIALVDDAAVEQVSEALLAAGATQTFTTVVQ